jgi:peptidoglycan hydrolase-like protein with peptidoglycan-binding domain
MLYSRSVGKICPGPARIAQIPSLFAQGTGGIGGGTSPVVIPAPTYSADYVREVQTLLNAAGANLVVDGDLGPVTKAAIVAYQTAAGLVVDGDPGPLTLAALRTATQEEEVMALTDDDIKRIWSYRNEGETGDSRDAFQIVRDAGNVPAPDPAALAAAIAAAIPADLAGAVAASLTSRLAGLTVTGTITGALE